MKYAGRMIGVIACAMLVSPAHALTVTNLDRVAHTVELSGGGTPERRVIAPDATEYFTSGTRGRLALVTSAPKAKAKASRAALQTDGILRRYIGNGNVSWVTADPDNSYVIWPDGDLRVQGRRRSWR